MSLAEKLTELAIKERVHFGNLNLLDIDDMIALFNGKYTVPNPNLLEGSATLINTGRTTYDNNNESIGYIGVVVNRNNLDPFGNVTVDTNPWCELMPTLTLSKGTYTFSTNIKAVDNSNNTKLGFYVRKAPSGAGVYQYEQNYDLSSYKRLSWTFTLSDDEKVLMFVTNEAISTIRLGSLKLEAGSQATPWCLAPFELDGGGELNGSPLTYLLFLMGGVLHDFE